jgi:hypothetical protein
VFKETYSLVKDFSEHNFANRSEKIENVKKITRIKRQDLAIIHNATW